MKKIILTLAVMAFPLAVHAQTPVPLGSHASEQSVQAAIDLLANAACGKGSQIPKTQARAVYECYQKTDENSPDIDICILADLSIFKSANAYRKEHDALGDPNPYEGIPFITKEAFFKRINHFRASPRFIKLREEPFKFNDYFKNEDQKNGNNIVAIVKNVNAKCKNMGY